MKTLKNSYGSSGIQLLLALVVMGIVCFTGWYVWQANQNASKTLNDASKNSTSQPTITKKTTTQTEQKYSFSNPAFSFSYPDSWKVEDATQENKAGDTALRAYINVTSPDYKLDSSSDSLSVVSGGMFNVNARNVNATQLSDLDDIPSEGQGVSKIKLDGVDAIRNEECGQSSKNGICVYAVKDSVLYTLWYLHGDKETSTNAKYLKEYNEFVSSFSFD